MPSGIWPLAYAAIVRRGPASIRIRGKTSALRLSSRQARRATKIENAGTAGKDLSLTICGGKRLIWQSNMERKLLVIIEGLRFEIEGQEILLIKIPMPSAKHSPDATIEEITKPVDYLIRLQKQAPVVFVAPKSDGTLEIVAPREWREKFRSKTILVSQLTKIPIYEDDEEQPPGRVLRH